MSEKERRKLEIQIAAVAALLVILLWMAGNMQVVAKWILLVFGGG